jgi:hypothetical protein
MLHFAENLPPYQFAKGQGPPALIVQVVDPVSIPLPDSEVTVKPASGKGSSKSEHADDNGYAKFWVETGMEYTIEAKTHGFNKKTLNTSLLRKQNRLRPRRIPTERMPS